jgi:Phosphoesterase family
MQYRPTAISALAPMLMVACASLAVAHPVPAATRAGQPCGTATAAPAYTHVIWIWMENHSYGQVIGSAAAPFETALAHACGTATSYHDVGSPSLPNYIGATSGGTQGIKDDNSPGLHRLTVDNIFRQVRASGQRARSYLESMPGHCAQNDSGAYWAHHNPEAYYVGGNDRSACQSDDLPISSFGHDLYAGLPAFSFVAPNVCHDTHNCPVSSGDAWLGQWIPKIVASPGYRAGKTAVFVVWDESTPVPNLVIGPHTPPGTRFGGWADHYALLRTTEDMLGLSHLGRANSAPSLRGPFHL